MRQDSLLSGPAGQMWRLAPFLRTNEESAARLADGAPDPARSIPLTRATDSGQNAERSHARKIAVVSDERRGVDSQRARGLDSVG